tara:strand:- start:3764 stop:4135 length:372 start_codon:yes stop_codon:yes gene_type:complete
LKTISKNLFDQKSLNGVLIGLVIFLLLGCKGTNKIEGNEVSINKVPYVEYEINELKIKLSQLEALIHSQPKKNKVQDLKTQANNIKSITFRIGSEDDRIRIYWNDGSKTDLPCTKEQSIWACG